MGSNQSWRFEMARPIALLGALLLLATAGAGSADEQLVLNVLAVDEDGRVVAADRIVSLPGERVLTSVRDEEPTMAALYRYTLAATGESSCRTSL